MKGDIKIVLWMIVFFLLPEAILLSISLKTGLTAVILFILGGVVSLQIIVLVFILTAPLTAGFFVSTIDNRKHIPLFPLFVAIENGRAKAIVDQGGNAIRYVINQHDAGFLMKMEYDRDISEDNLWHVIKDEGNKYSNGRNWWERLIENKTGLAFVGIYPWRRVYRYELHPIKMLTKNGSRVLFIPPEPSVSDHVRVREFNWGAEVTVLLKDRFQVSILYSFRLRCNNPHKLLFGVDNWDESFADAIASRTIETLQNVTLDDLTKMGDTEKSLIALNVKKISNSVDPNTEKNWGLEIIEAQISKYEIKTVTEEERVSLTIEEVTKRNMKARALEYETEKTGEANVIEARAKSIESHGEAGKQASRDQMLETAAKEGQQTVITGLGNSQSSGENEATTLLKAILAKLR